MVKSVRVETRNVNDVPYVVAWKRGDSQYSLENGGCYAADSQEIKPEATSGTRVSFEVDLKAWGASDSDIKKAVGGVMETNGYSVVFEDEVGQIEQHDFGDLIEDDDEEDFDDDFLQQEGAGTGVGETSVEERAKYIPFRLSLGERKMLRLVEASMSCTTYTDQVDREFKSEGKRMAKQLKGIAGILGGLVLACAYDDGQKVARGEQEFSHYEPFFKNLFEIARRHKIMNPEKMRAEYGTLIMLLMDMTNGTIREELNFDVREELNTVHKFLEEHDGTDLLRDRLIETATQEILAGRKERHVIQQEIRRKERAVKVLKEKYSSHKLSEDDIHTCLYSISDNNSFLNSNRLPVDKMIAYLQEYFDPKEIEEGYSLSIVKGNDGARLSHSHEKQFYFALQSLTLWQNILDDMFRLWSLAEADLLSDSVEYQLKDTGQGYQRVQQSPNVYRAMQQILAKVQGKVGRWIGSSMIHLGDHNVPNALTYVDKYCQVSRILGPIVLCIENVEKMVDEDEYLEDWIKSEYGGLETLKKDILYDFFRSAFDGSGADNFYDAGSCIDGRLTSAWNWCQQLPEKDFYPIFKLTGFVGFDGDFK